MLIYALKWLNLSFVLTSSQVPLNQHPDLEFYAVLNPSKILKIHFHYLFCIHNCETTLKIVFFQRCVICTLYASENSSFEKVTREPCHQLAAKQDTNLNMDILNLILWQFVLELYLVLKVFQRIFSMWA